MSGELGLLFEGMKDKRRRGERTDMPSEPHDPVRGAAGDAIARLTSIFSPETMASTSLARLIDVGALAERVFGNASKASAWMYRPNRSLAGQQPVDLLADELGSAVVKETLERIDHGIFA